MDLRSFLGLQSGHAGFQGTSTEVHEAIVGSSPFGRTLQSVVPVSLRLA